MLCYPEKGFSSRKGMKLGGWVPRDRTEAKGRVQSQNAEGRGA